jgi:adenine phosphoribosyltransferase
MLGYLTGGVAIGPNVLELFQKADGVRHLGEFGVVLLMFVNWLAHCYMQVTCWYSRACPNAGGGTMATVTAMFPTTLFGQAMQHTSINQYLRDNIRTVPDWPTPGVQFRDITPLLQNAKVFRVLIDAFVHRYMDPGMRPDIVAGLDARGFILGAVVAYELNVGFVPIRKKGKLPFTTVEETYELEYGSATVELHTDAVKEGDRVLLIDDLIATGGTMMAGRKLLERLGAHVMEGAAIVDLPELGGSQKIRDSGLPLFTLVDFSGH